MIAEKDTVYQKFPTPLINRLEKHFVLTSSVLEDWQTELLRELEHWISKFCETRYKAIRLDLGHSYYIGRCANSNSDSESSKKCSVFLSMPYSHRL